MMLLAYGAKRVTFHISFCFMILLFCVSHPTPSQAHSQPKNPLENKNVLILNAFESNVPAFEKTNQGLSAALQSGGVPFRNQFYEHLDLGRNPGPENRRLIVEIMSRRYGQRKIDLIITLYPEGLKFLLDEARGVFSDVPVLALFLPQGFKAPKTKRRIIPHLVIPDLKRTIEIALNLVPTTQRVYVVGGTHTLDKWLENKARQDFKRWEGRLEIHYLSDLPVEEILTTVSNAPSHSIVLTTVFSKDVTGTYQTTVELSRQLAQVSKAPVFGLLDTLIGNGIVGGSLISFHYIGTKAGEMAVDILRGTRYAENTPVVLEVPQLDKFDWRQLKYWNLNESALPKGSIIVNREFSLWDFRYYMIGGLALILAQSLLIFGLLAYKHRRRSAEVSLRHKTEELNKFFSITLELLCIANTDGYFLVLNPAWERTLGYSREELMEKRFFDFVHPDDQESTMEAVAILLSQEEIIHFENRYRCKDGTYRSLDWTSALAGKTIYAAARDITERKQAEKRLNEQLTFETLQTEISAQFVKIPTDRMAGEVEDAQRRICENLGLDLCVIWQWSEEEPNFFTLAYVYSALEDWPRPERIDAQEAFPWQFQKVLQGETLAFSTGDLPPEASLDEESRRILGIKSSVVVPLAGKNGQFNGVMSFNTLQTERDWPKETVKGLKLLAQVFADALERKRQEEALRESEARLKLATDSAGAGIWELNWSNSTFWATEQAREIFGYGLEELISMERFEASIHPDDLELVRQTISQALEGAPINVEYRILDSDGGWKWISSLGRPHFDSAGKPIRLIGVSLDITDRKRAEQELEERLRFEHLVSDLSARFVNLSPDRVDHEIEYGLKQILEFLQVDRVGLVRTLPGKSAYEITHIAYGEDVPPVPLRTEIPMSMNPWAYEKMILKRKVIAFSRLDDLPPEASVDKQTWAEWGILSNVNIPILVGEPIDRIIAINSVKRERVWPEELFPRLQLLGEIFVNALERKNMAERIIKGAEEWQATFDSIPDVIMILDPDLKVVRHNAAAVSFFGLPSQEILGRHCYELMHGTEGPPLDCPAKRSLHNLIHQEREMYHADRKAWYQMSSDPVFDEQGQVRRIIYRIKDITERLKADADARQHMEALAHVTRVGMMGELTTSLAHEINQPLTAIQSNAEAAQRFMSADVPDTIEVCQILDDIIRDNRRASNVIGKIRDLIKKKPVPSAPLDLNDMIQDALSLVGGDLDLRGLAITTDFFPALPLVVADRTQLQQVILNLILNGAAAMKATPPDQKQLIIKTEMQENLAVKVSVIDFGTGIDDHDIERLFEPFYTTKTEGMGMGLSISRTIISAHGGTISAANNPEGGATFFFELPAHQGDRS
jgi:PAS domain S-box-containing protein